MKRILVTPRSMSGGQHTAFERLELAGFELFAPTPGVMPSEADLVAAIPGCCGWIAGVEPVSPRVIEAAHDLAVISRNGSGIDNLPLELLDRRGIRVARAVGANANGVAELALALMLASFRHIPVNDRGIREGAWPRNPGREIKGATIGVLGLGAIGTLMADKLLRLGANVLGFDPFADAADLQRNDRFKSVQTLGELLPLCDALTLHMPLPQGGAPILTSVEFNAMKPGVAIVNTSRAGLVDQPALLDMLETHHVSAYGVDVFDTEPPGLTPLIAHERCISTSHIGGLTTESVARITEMTVDNLLSALQEAGLG